ncbi:MAG: hypothetical protein L0228_08470 [Planctomycetes bacterium]|nr:hypothetical protein [Planctomycetota bacterium]
MRQLLAFVAFVSLLLAAVVSTQGMTALALLLATLVVVLHVFGTALGTQLRSHADHSLENDAPRQSAGGPTGPPIPHMRLSHEVPRPQPRSPWHERRSTPLPWLPRLIVAAFVLGGAFGVVVLSVTIGHRTSPAGIVVGAFSLAVLAGWFAFVGYSFYGVFRHGLRDAMADERRDQRQ